MAKMTKRARTDQATRKFLERVDKLLPLYPQASAALNKSIDVLEADWPKDLAAADFIIRPKYRKDLKRARYLTSCLLVWLPMPDASEAECERLLASIEHVGKWLSGAMDRKPKRKAKVAAKKAGERRTSANAKSR